MGFAFLRNISDLSAVKCFAERDVLAAGFTAVFVGIAQGIDAATIFLLIEMLALRDFDHAIGTAVFAPVIIPIFHAFVARGGAAAAIIDLLHVFPARNAETRRE